MFYGGKLSSHLSGEDEDEIVEDLISLRSLNRNAVIVMDSDKIIQAQISIIRK